MANSEQFDKLQFGPEASAYGTEATSYEPIARVQSSELVADNQFIYDRGIGEGLNVTNTYYGQFLTSGSANFDVVDFKFLQHWIGSRTGAGTAGDKYIFTEATSIVAQASASTVLVPFSVEKANADTENNTFFQTGCVGTTFSLTGALGSKLSCSCAWLAQSFGYRQTSDSYTPVTDPAYVMLGGTWKWGTTPTAIAGVREFTLNYANNLVGEGDETRTINSRFKSIPHLGQRAYTGTVTIIMAQALATTIINDFFGKVAGGVYTPEDGSTSVSPPVNLEFQVNLVNASENAILKVDKTSIDNISMPTSLGGGLSLLTFSFTAMEGTANVPITYWTA